MKWNQFKLGATGNYPRGKADDTDEGELQLAVAVDAQMAIIRIAFGKPVAWIGLPAQEARALAAMLTEKADELDRRRT